MFVLIERDKTATFCLLQCTAPPYILSGSCRLKANDIKFNLKAIVYDNMNSDYLEQVSCSNKQMLNIAAEVISDDLGHYCFTSDHGWKFNHAIPEQVAETGLSDYSTVRYF